MKDSVDIESFLKKSDENLARKLKWNFTYFVDSLYYFEKLNFQLPN